jgi:RecB family endonuclease NucS
MNGNTIEIDLLAISADSVYIIEIKSKYRKDDLKQLLKHIEKYRENTPEHQNKKIYGVIVATDYNKDNIKELERRGIYFISIADDLVKLHIAPDFTPKSW